MKLTLTSSEPKSLVSRYAKLQGRMTEPPAYLFSKTILSKSAETKINRSTKLAPGLPPNLISRLSQEHQLTASVPAPSRPGPVSSAPSVSVKRYLGNHKQSRKQKMQQTDHIFHITFTTPLIHRTQCANHPLKDTILPRTRKRRFHSRESAVFRPVRTPFGQNRRPRSTKMSAQ